VPFAILSALTIPSQDVGKGFSHCTKSIKNKQLSNHTNPSPLTTISNTNVHSVQQYSPLQCRSGGQDSISNPTLSTLITKNLHTKKESLVAVL
jgi:hypothetical protein